MKTHLFYIFQQNSVITGEEGERRGKREERNGIIPIIDDVQVCISDLGDAAAECLK
jgi:hypothetical protein